MPHHVDVLTNLDPLLTSVITPSEQCQELNAGDTQPGDVVFFANTYITRPSHVGIVTETETGGNVS